MKLRKTVAIAALAATAFTASACGQAGTGEDEITLALSTQTNPFFVQVRDGARERAEELGVQLNVQDAGDDALMQADQLGNAAAMGAGVVVVNPVDSDAVGNSVIALNQEDIPVIAVDRTSNGGELTSYVASDNIDGGQQAADVLAEAIGEQGKVIILQGIPGSSSSRDRGEGFRSRIAEYPGIEVVAQQTASFDRTEGLDVATNLLQAHPDVDAIFAENDEMALGAIEAAGARAGEEIAIVGFDGTDEGLAAVEEGTMTATIAQQPWQLGVQAVEQGKRLLDGLPVADVVPVAVVPVTAQNVAEFLPKD
ncbi:D-ribose ABC transporter substrate-binding protein [Corynebacterium yudongzhengii]|uniref:D-ribose ABC transporter substrate-binding protein n=1 Tax=Corynebacterium yudongzhengii TaxID=2080740 RepID=A0A2U1T6T8_9CORY|nr:substrate-binding domain-containing protein [Corynebacterium yudongzhengii]AWB82265.1 D-ribose ABC transporter substrate-binding protein [Corynebacterium yudongzhengii]PWC01714.1 D-ribose ABC transporter substrate-binding protein [Corynebacterium yudongzhengii]